MLRICVTVFLSYLPEAGQYSSFFLYLRQVRPPPINRVEVGEGFISVELEALSYRTRSSRLFQVIAFSPAAIAGFIAMVGILSIVAQVHEMMPCFIFSPFPRSARNALCLCQTLLLSVLMRTIGNKNTVLLGLGFQLFQLAWYGFGSEPW